MVASWSFSQGDVGEVAEGGEDKEAAERAEVGDIQWERDGPAAAANGAEVDPPAGPGSEGNGGAVPVDVRRHFAGVSSNQRSSSWVTSLIFFKRARTCSTFFPDRGHFTRASASDRISAVCALSTRAWWPKRSHTAWLTHQLISSGAASVMKVYWRIWRSQS